MGGDVKTIFLVIWIIYTHSFTGTTIEPHIEKFDTKEEVEFCISNIPERQSFSVYKAQEINVERVYKTETWKEEIIQRKRDLKEIKWDEL